MSKIQVDESQGTVKHILERAGLHFGLAVMVFALALVFVRWLMVATPAYADDIFAAVLVFAITAPREAYDVAHGQPVKKVIYDYISWIAGAIFALFLLKLI